MAAIDARGLNYPLLNGGRVKYDLEYDSINDLYRFKGKPQEVIKILHAVATDVFFDSLNDYEPEWVDSSALNYNYSDQVFFDVALNKNFVILSSAVTGDCLANMDAFVNNPA